MTLLLLTLACAAPSEAEAYVRATGGELPLVESLAECALTGDRDDACRTEVVRRRPESRAGDCLSVGDTKWRGECFFAVAERHARAGDRWGALAACGSAGTYYGECLYHGWTYELQRLIPGDGRAIDQIEPARPAIAYWSQLQTIVDDPVNRLWDDWWFFALEDNPPADITDCQRLTGEDAARCVRGTLAFVERVLYQNLHALSGDPRRASRICRSGPESVLKELGPLWREAPELEGPTVAGLRRACSGEELIRPWNPVLAEERRWSAG